MQTGIGSTTGVMLSVALLSCPATFTLADKVIHQANAGSSVEAGAANAQVILQLAQITRVPWQTQAHSPPLVRATRSSILARVDIAGFSGDGNLTVNSMETSCTEALV